MLKYASCRSDIWFDLYMPDKFLTPGERFQLIRHCGNQSMTGVWIDEYVFLEVMGSYWFWPAWFETLDFETWFIPAESEFHDIHLDFVWPEDTGSFQNLRFWGGFLDHGLRGTVRSLRPP